MHILFCARDEIQTKQILILRTWNENGNQIRVEGYWISVCQFSMPFVLVDIEKSRNQNEVKMSNVPVVSDKR